MARKEWPRPANVAAPRGRLGAAQAPTVIGGPLADQLHSQQPTTTGKPLPRFLRGHKNGAANLDEAAPATPRLGAAKDGSTPGRRPQLRAEPEERHFTSQRRGTGLRLFTLLLLLFAVAGLAYLQSQGRLNEHELRSVARSLGAESWLLRAGLIAEQPSNGTGLSLAELTEIERLLDQLAFAPGPVDGVIDERSAGAIRSFQDLAGAVPNGSPSRALLKELRVLVALQRRQPQT
ncbi:MAG: peptidoglycan-binding domain-containing protein [Kiloniellales bacterium]